ncbi:MAG: aminodeoxychorismate synthase component I [Bacteroidota bacterium]
MLNWAADFAVLSYLDSNQLRQNGTQHIECLLAVGVESQLCFTAEGKHKSDPFQQLRDFYERDPDWLFGYLTYDLKNSIEQLSSRNFDGLGFPEMHFFRPIYVFKLTAQSVHIYSKAQAPAVLFEQIIQSKTPKASETNLGGKIQLKARITEAEYLKTIETIQGHLHRGDLYELNFCQEFFADHCTIDPLELFRRLNRLSQAPFSAYYRLNNRYLLCASPERFLQKKGQQIISQPIKGTIKRGQTPRDDQQLKQTLLHSQKDRSENVMIVDLVRNDLAKSCIAGSIKVEELFGIYTFEQVHQMISTISGTLRPEVHFIDAIRNAFPMGSMTGAPKVRSMQLIEQYEKTKRGLYSGAIGYIDPHGDFDFNVVIRSIMYHAHRQYLSFQVGGAIVYDSIPEKEYEECLLKAKGILTAMDQLIEPLSVEQKRQEA